MIKIKIKALVGLLITVVLMLLPLLVNMVVSNAEGVNIVNYICFKDEVLRGAYIISAISIMAPILYAFINMKGEDRRGFWLNFLTWTMVISVLIWAVIYVVYCLGGKFSFKIVLFLSIFDFLCALFPAYRIKVSEYLNEVTPESLETARKKKEATLKKGIKAGSSSHYVHKSKPVKTASFAYEEDDE